jgi:predicted DNA-binding transcriptional regulator AlpA
MTPSAQPVPTHQPPARSPERFRTACANAHSLAGDPGGRQVLTDTPDPLLIPDREGARLCGISRATWHRLRAMNRIGPQPVRLGRAVRYRRAEVVAWVEAGCPDARTWAAMAAMDRRAAHAV